MMKKVLLISMICVLCLNLFGQTRKIDSLKKELHYHHHDTVENTIYHHLSVAYLYINPDTALHYAQHGLKQAKELKFMTGISGHLTSLGVSKFYKNEFDSSIFYYRKSLKYDSINKDTIMMAAHLDNIGLAYSQLDKQDSSLFFHLKSEKLANLSKKDILIARSCYYLGGVYYRLDERNNALEQYKKGATINSKIGNTNGQIQCLNNVGVILKDMSNYSEAIKIYERSLFLQKKHHPKNQAPYAEGNLAMIYFDIGEYQKSITTHKKILVRVREYFGNYGSAQSYIYIGLSYLKLNNGDSAQKYLNEGSQYIEKIERIKDRLSIVENISKTYAELNLFDSAYSYKMESYLLLDSISKLNKTEVIQDLKTKYETEKKEQEILLLNKEKELNIQELQSKQQQLYTAIVLVVFITITFLISIYFYRKIKSQRLELQKQKQFQDNVLRVIPHNLFSPLASMKGLFINLDEQLENKNTKKALEISKDVSSKSLVLNKILRRLHNLALSNKTEQDINPTSIQVIKSMNEALALHDGSTKLKNIKVNLDIEDKLEAYVDLDSLNNILENLIDNAVKYSPEHKTIDISANKVGLSTAIEITTNGKKFTQPEMDTIVSTENDNNSKGSIGLKISHNAAKINGGTLTVRNKNENSTTFTLKLPTSK